MQALRAERNAQAAEQASVRGRHELWARASGTSQRGAVERGWLAAKHKDWRRLRRRPPFGARWSCATSVATLALTDVSESGICMLPGSRQRGLALAPEMDMYALGIHKACHPVPDGQRRKARAIPRARQRVLVILKIQPGWKAAWLARFGMAPYRFGGFRTA